MISDSPKQGAHTGGLDTSGHVAIPAPAGNLFLCKWPDLSPFAQGYVEGMFAELDVWIEKYGDPALFPTQNPPRFSDLAPETLVRIIEDCERFCESWLGGPNPYTVADRDAGALLWAKRQEGTLPDFPPPTPYLGEDGLIYLKATPQSEGAE